MLGLQGVPAKTHDRIRTARLLAAALIDPDCRLEIMALSKRTGMHRDEILEVLTSPDWQESIRCHLLSMAGAGMMAVVDRLRGIALNDDERTADQIAAARALHAVWKDSAQIAAASQAVEDEETAKAFLKTVKPMKFRLLDEEKSEST